MKTLMYKVYLEALDNKVITPRTGKTEVLAQCDRLPNEGDYIMFMYLEELESPGVAIGTDNVIEDGSIIFFEDIEKRPFKITIIGNK